jgi:uncharacterized membrane protein
MKALITTGIASVAFACAFGAVNVPDFTAQNDTIHKKKIRHYQKEMVIDGAPDEVFAYMDDIRNTGMHMTESSGAMAGGKLELEWLSPYKTGLGTKYRWTGKAAGMKMDFVVEVSKWSAGREKVWGTVGDAKMIVIDWFEMRLSTTSEIQDQTEVKLEIYYTKSGGIIGLLLGKRYSKWCVKSMLKDTKKHFETSRNLKPDQIHDSSETK